MRSTPVVLAVALLLCACGDTDDGTGAAPSISSATPTPMATDEPCPTSADVTFGDSTPTAQTRLEPMLGQVLAYGQRHADVFGQHGLIWHASDDASVFASFVGPVAEHRAALEAIVEFPDDLIVCQVALSGADSMALITALTQEHGTRIQMAGYNGRTIDVGLASTDEALAAELAAQYGEALTITVGGLPYPIDLAVTSCTELPPAASAPAELDLSVTPDGPLSIGAVAGRPLDGDNGWGLVVMITNIGTGRVTFMSGVARAVLLDIDGRVVSSQAGLVYNDIGYEVDLAPGESTTVPILVAPTSCRPELGYTLPPGEYQIVAAVPHLPDGGPFTEIVTAPFPVTLVA